MKIFSTSLFLLCAVIFGCKDEPVRKNCGTPAIVRDLTSLDGCWFVFELNDGTRLIPVWDIMYCGTAPLPKEVTEDPLYNFQYTDGKKVIIGYEERPDHVNDCTAGRSVKITCLEVVDTEVK